MMVLQNFKKNLYIIPTKIFYIGNFWNLKLENFHEYYSYFLHDEYVLTNTLAFSQRFP